MHQVVSLKDSVTGIQAIIGSGIDPRQHTHDLDQSYQLRLTAALGVSTDKRDYPENAYSVYDDPVEFP